MKKWQPGLIVTDHDEAVNPANRLEKKIASHLALTLRLISHVTKMEHKHKNASAKN